MMIVFALLGLSILILAVRWVRRPTLGTFSVIFLLALLTIIFLGPMTGRIDVAQHYSALQTCRTITLAEFQYSNDYNGKYPDGRSSTEIFQKLIDGNYISDPNVFYIPMEGKTRPVEGKPLKPENVSYDVTGGINGSVPNGLPLVFATGYRVNYHAGGKLLPLDKTHPFEMGAQRTWFQWLNFTPDIVLIPPVSRAGSSSTPELPPGEGTDEQNSQQDFDAHGQVYRQLTPDGVLK